MTLSSKILLLAAVLSSIIQNTVAPPVTQKQAEAENDILDNIGVEYKRYLQEVIQALESDNEFRAKLEKAEDADLRSGKIAQELQYVKHDVRSKLDELKRAELERLRHYIRKQAELKQGLDPDHIKNVNEKTGHIDGSNPHSFEIADLEKLIAKTTQHLAEADRKRREEFKQYEMQKEFERSEMRKSMSQRDQHHFDQKLNEERQALMHRQQQLHHPGSKKQLEEVWQYQDHMNPRDFDPKTFFFMHDVDGNGFLDQEEVKALFLRELEKLYSMGYPGEDLRERTEEMERMREHVFTEADTNHDGVISLQEWLELTRRPDFNNDPGWDVLEPKKEYTEEEYHQFEMQRQREIEALIAAGKLARKTPQQIQREAMYAKQNEEALAALANSKDVYEAMKQQREALDPKYVANQGPPVYQQEQKTPHEHYKHDQSPDHIEFQQQLHAAQQLHAQQQQAAHHQQQQLPGQLPPLPGQQPPSYGQQPPPQQFHQQPPMHAQQEQLHGQQPPMHQQQQLHGQQPPMHQQQQLHGQQPPMHQQQQLHGQQPPMHAQQQQLHQQQAAVPQQVHSQEQPSHSQQQAHQQHQQQPQQHQQPAAQHQQQPQQSAEAHKQPDQHAAAQDNNIHH